MGVELLRICSTGLTLGIDGILKGLSFRRMFEESLRLFCYSGLTLYVSSPVSGLQLVNGARLAAERSEKGLYQVA